MARPMRVKPQQQSTIPVAILSMPKVTSTGPQHRRRRVRGGHALDQRRSQYPRHRCGRTFRTSDRKRDRTAQRKHSADNRRGDEGGGNSVGQRWGERPGKDQQRIGEPEGGGQDTRGGSAKNVIERGSYRRIEAEGLIGHS